MRKYMVRISRYLTMGLIGILLASVFSFLTFQGFSVTASSDGISFSTAQYGKSFVSVSLDKTYAYAKLNKSGCQVAKDGLIYLRYDLFLHPEAARYSDYHVTVMDETSKEYKEGYIGAKDKSGAPLDTQDYQKWLDSLPTVTRDNPFLCVFVVVPTAVTPNEIGAIVNNFLNKAYSAYEQYGSAVYSASIIRQDLKTAKVDAIVKDSSKSKSNQDKYNALVSITEQASIDTFNPTNKTITVSLGVDNTLPVAATTIDVGAGAVTLASSYSSRTIVALGNPANDTGLLDTFEIYFVTGSPTNVKMGSFYGSSTSYTNRDYFTWGSVSSGSKQTSTGQSVDVSSGDFLGSYHGAGYLYAQSPGYAGTYYKSGDQFDAGTQTYALINGGTVSLYATGETAGVAAPTNVAATDGTYTDKVVITWTKSAGANAYKVLRGATNASGTLGDVATYDDTGADAPTITAGAAVASDGTSTAQVSLSLSGTSVANGTTHSYTVYASNDGGSTWSDASTADNGYIGHGSLTYQWQKSASTTDADYSNISGATAATYDDTAAPAPTVTAGTASATDGTETTKVVLSIAGESANNGAVRYYKCVLNATGATEQTSTANDGYRGVGALTFQWKVSAADSDASFSDIGGGTTDPYDYTSAPAGSITAGTASATDGTEPNEVTLSIAGEGTTNGAGRYYYCVVSATGAASADTTHDRGYRGVGAITYQWKVSAADSDASFSNIASGTTDPYSYSDAPVGTITAGTATATDGTETGEVTLTVSGMSMTDGAGRYYYCTLSATGAADADTNHDRGYKSAGTLTYQWKVSAADSDASFSDIGGGTTNPYSYTDAPAGVITPGTATASDGTSGSYVTLTLTGASIADGAGRYYYCVVSSTGATPQDTTHDRGYRSAASLTYQWQRSAADSDADYSNIDGATTNPYNDTGAPAGSVSVTTQIFAGFGRDWVILKGAIAEGGTTGRYYLCVVSAVGSESANSTHDRGYRSASSVSVTEVGFDYGLTTGYGSSLTSTGSWSVGDVFVLTIRDLTPATVYHYRAKANASGWNYGSDSYVCTVGSPVVYEYLNTGYDDDSSAIYANNYTAQQFTTQTTSHTVTRIKLYIKRVGSPGDVIVQLYHANTSHEPTGLAISSGTLDGNVFSTGYQWLAFEIDEVSIVGGEEYAIVVSASGGDVDNYVMIGKDAGGGLDNAVGLSSTDGGSTWASDSPVDYLFEIWGNSCIRVVSGLAYQNYITNGDVLFALEGINIYPPYVNEDTGNPTVDPKLYFTVRLLDTDGITVLATTPLVQFGDKPSSIYISASQAATLTMGGAYYLEIYGTFTGNPSSSYQLTGTDWSGNIGGWVIATAHSMEDYYSTATSPVYFTTYSSVVSSEVLNSDSAGGGGTIFQAGIPYLMETHPELFQVRVIQPNFTAPSTQVAPLTGVWQDMVGASIAGTFTTIGTMLGISGKYIGAVLLAIIYFTLPIAIGNRGGTPLIAMIIGFPIIGFGVWAFLVDYVIVAVIILLAAVITFIGYWVTRT